MARDWTGYVRMDDVELAALARHGVQAYRIEAMKRTRDEYDAEHGTGDAGHRHHDGDCDCLCGRAILVA